MAASWASGKGGLKSLRHSSRALFQSFFLEKYLKRTEGWFWAVLSRKVQSLRVLP